MEESVPSGLKHSLGGIVTLSLCYATIFILSLIGNVVVILTVRRNPSMQTVINFFLCNLSVADILVVILLLPITLLQNIYHEWHWGDFMCRTVPYLQGTTVCASVFTLSVVAFDRYLAICHPLKRFFNLRRAKVCIFTIWVVSPLILSPWAIFYKLEVVYNQTVCLEHWPSVMMRNAYFLGVICVILYALPLFFITVFYSAIAYRMWYRLRTTEGRGKCKTDKILQSTGGIDKSKSIKIVKMLAIVVGLFALSWLPIYCIFNIIYLAKLDPTSIKFILDYLVPISQLLGASNSCVNPWIYCLYSKNYRDSFKTILLCRRSLSSGDPRELRSQPPKVIKCNRFNGYRQNNQDLSNNHIEESQTLQCSTLNPPEITIYKESSV